MVLVRLKVVPESEGEAVEEEKTKYQISMMIMSHLAILQQTSFTLKESNDDATILLSLDDFAEIDGFKLYVISK